MKQFRLWIDRNGDPRYIEMLGGEVSLEIIEECREQLEKLKSIGKTAILSSEWEVRVIA